MKNILFLCTENSCRSKIAEAFLRHIAGDKFNAYSAGVGPTSLNQFAIKAMQEIGIDITNQRSKSIQELSN